MTARIDVDDINGVNGIEVMINRITCIGIDHPRIKTNSQHSRDTGFGTRFATLPFVVCIPGRRLAHLAWIFMDRRIHVGGTGLDARLQY